MKKSIFAAVFLGGMASAQMALAAGPFTVNIFNDTHASVPSSSPNDSGGHVSLRSAIEAASAQAGPTTINVPPGTYNLTLGELAVALNGNNTIVIQSSGTAANTIVNQTDGNNRVFNIDYNSVGNTKVTIAGLTVQGGHDAADVSGGAGILAGSIDSTPKDVLTLTNCYLLNNHCLGYATATTTETGGGVQMAGGDLNVISCVFSNDTSGASEGGGIEFLTQTVAASLNVTNSYFLNNSLTNDSTSGPDGGGAIDIHSTAGSVHNIIGSTFTGNHVVGTAGTGNTVGGAIYLNTGTLNINNSTFTGNSATGTSDLGGAIFVDKGTLNLSFCRLVGNTATGGGGALYNHGSNGANSYATNNWWGCNGGPGAGGCDVATSNGGTLAINPWLIITNTASPATISSGQSTTLTASVLRNSSNQVLTAAQVPVLIGLPLTWNGLVHGSLSSVQASIQANGQATATFTSDGTCNSGSANVTLDNGTATATVTVQCPDLTVTEANNVGGTIPFGNSWTWTVHVTNATASSIFATGNTIALDNLPNANIGYGSPTIANASGVVGTLIPAIDGSKNLTVTASGSVTLNAGCSFDIQFTATPAAMGSYGNPRSGGFSVVDPNNNVSESNEGNNNAAADTVTVTCPTITGTVSGNSSICAGSSAIVTVTVSGGTPPYSVTLNNGGGTQVGTSPLIFTVNPIATTTYQISSGTNNSGCPITGSGSATVTIIPLITPTITLAPASLLANSAGNQASAQAGFASYAWTITNGIIVGPTNQAVVTYVAGSSNNVMLGLSAFNGCAYASAAATVPIITGFSVHTNVTFTDTQPTTTMTMAFDGTNYWSCSGGGPSGIRLSRYGLNGAAAGTYSPGLDFRSVFTKADGTLLARAFNSGVIYQQTSPGVLASSGITLTGGALDPQSAVVLNGAGTEFQAMTNGVVSRWTTNGSYIGTVNLIGFGTIVGEANAPQNRGLAVMANFWLTYNGAGVLSIWDTAGNRITQINLPGAGTSFDSGFSFSYCNGKVFIVDVAGGTWRGYDLFTSARVAVYGAPSTDSWNADVQGKIARTGLIPQVDAFLVNGANPIPTLASLRNYQAVLVYSDAGFSDNIGLGNVLADYVDQGGGAALGTFVFYNSGGLSIQGRLVSGGYLPFSTGNQASGTELTLVKDLPNHPLLDGVTAFDGGSASFHNSPVTNAAGATLVAHWTDGQPLISGKSGGSGQSVGLNFYPPSSDARSDFWKTSTDGARLMANALLWAGKIPPTIIAAPAGQILPLGAAASFQVVATGTSPLVYQWRLNGTNLPTATNSTLSFTVQNTSSGAYSVVVSNLYGTTTSLNASLNPQLRFLPPVVAGGNFSLFLADADGSPVATNRAARVSLYATTNLALPMPLWTLLTNVVVPSGSQLRADGFSTTNSSSRFFRVVEAP